MSSHCSCWICTEDYFWQWPEVNCTKFKMLFSRVFFKFSLWWPQGNFKRPLGGIWETVLHWCDVRSLYFERPLEEFERPFGPSKHLKKNTAFLNLDYSKFPIKQCCDRKARAACAQSFTLWQQATIEFMRRNHSIIACSRHIYMVLFFTHIPFVVNRAEHRAF